MRAKVILKNDLQSLQIDLKTLPGLQSGFQYWSPDRDVYEKAGFGFVFVFQLTDTAICSQKSSSMSLCFFEVTANTVAVRPYVWLPSLHI